jgi:hypothetical protein
MEINVNISNLATELSELIGQTVTVENIHPTKEDRYYYIQAPKAGTPLLLHHYRGPFFIDIHPDDYKKIASGDVTPHDYITTANWQVGYFWGGGSMVNGGYYQPMNLVKQNEEVRRYLQLLSCRGHYHSCGYMPTKEYCEKCFIEDCPFSKYKKGSWDKENQEPDPRRSFFNALYQRFEKENPGYSFKGFLCGDIPDEEIRLNPNSHYNEQQPYEFTAYASKNVIRALLTHEIEPDDWDKYAAGFKFVIHKLFDEHTFEVTPDTLEKAFEGIDYTKKVSSTEPVIDVYDEKVPLMTRLAALFKKTP